MLDIIWWLRILLSFWNRFYWYVYWYVFVGFPEDGISSIYSHPLLLLSYVTSMIFYLNGRAICKKNNVFSHAFYSVSQMKTTHTINIKRKNINMVRVEYFVLHMLRIVSSSFKKRICRNSDYKPSFYWPY